MFPTLSLYSAPSLSMVGRIKFSSGIEYRSKRGHRNTPQICASFRSEISQFTRSSVTHQRIFLSNSSLFIRHSSFVINSQYHESNDDPPQRPTVTVACFWRSDCSVLKNHSVISVEECVIFISSIFLRLMRKSRKYLYAIYSKNS